MDSFIHLENLRRFSDLLRDETDPERRETLHALLIEEEDQLGRRRERLEQVQNHIASLHVRLARQDVVIQNLEADGRDSALARQLRTAWGETLVILERYRANL